MTIEGANTTYEVIQLVKSGPLRTVYMCRESGQTGNTVSVIEIKNMGKWKAFMEFAVTELSADRWPDFKEYFQHGGHFYLVFQYSSEPLLREKLSEEACSVSERLHIGEKLLEQISIYNVPAFFLEDALSISHVTVSGSHEIGFRYELDKLKSYGRIEMPQVCSAISVWVKTLLENELKDKVFLRLNHFYKDLRKGNFGSALEVFLEYRKVSAYFLAYMSSDAEPEPNSLLFVWWKAVKGFWHRTKYIWGSLLCVAAAALIWLLLFAGPASPAEVRLWKKIGTVEVYEGGE